MDSKIQEIREIFKKGYFARFTLIQVITLITLVVFELLFSFANDILGLKLSTMENNKSFYISHLLAFLPSSTMICFFLESWIDIIIEHEIGHYRAMMEVGYIPDYFRILFRKINPTLPDLKIEREKFKFSNLMSVGMVVNQDRLLNGLTNEQIIKSVNGAYYGEKSIYSESFSEYTKRALFLFILFIIGIFFLGDIVPLEKLIIGFINFVLLVITIYTFYRSDPDRKFCSKYNKSSDNKTKLSASYGMPGEEYKAFHKYFNNVEYEIVDIEGEYIKVKTREIKKPANTKLSNYPENNSFIFLKISKLDLDPNDVKIGKVIKYTKQLCFKVI